MSLISVKGRILSEFPEFIKELNLSIHSDLDYSTIRVGSHTKLNWICKYCKDNYTKNPYQRIRNGNACPKKDCILINQDIIRDNKEIIYLDKFPELIKELDFNKHPNLDCSKINSGSHTNLNWICNHCKESYERNPKRRITENVACPKRECITKKSNEKCGIIPKIKRDVQIKKIVPEPSNEDVEEWKNIPGEFLLSKYQISSLGNLKNIEINYLLSSKPREDGYVVNRLYLDTKKQKSFLRHVLVANTFMNNYNKKPTINHINTLRNDNRVINLEWATYSEQCYKENRSKFYSSGTKIEQYDLEMNLINTWKSISEASKTLNINRRHILKVLKGEEKNNNGFIWKYYEEDILEDEIWKVLSMDGYDDVLVSTHGRIRRNNKMAYFGSLRNNGYYQTNINKGKKQVYFAVHRLVCMTFIENPNNLPIVNHKDSIRSNNKVGNLEWVTHEQNMQHSLKSNNGIKNNCRSKIVEQIDKEGNIKEFVSLSQASKGSNIGVMTISDRCNKKRDQSGEFIWRFKTI